MIRRINKLKLNIISLIIVIIALCFNYYKIDFSFNNNTNDEINNNLDIEICELIDVVDGDTIKVLYKNKVEKIRFLNVDTPECKHPDISKNTEKGKIAYLYTKELLKDKKILYLTKDKNDRDKYNRLLRLVWLEKPYNDSKEELLNKCINVKLIKDKMAKVVKYDDYKYYKIFKEIEND